MAKMFNKTLTKYIGALSLLMVLAVILRTFNLGYSDFQGDEIKALFLPQNGQSIWQFLLEQRKGPLQFFVTFMVKLVDFSYSNQLLVRFPFALAGVLSVYFFYKFIKIHFGNRIAFFSSFFFVTNGFLVALSRIAQYQSLVIFFSVLALFLLSLNCRKYVIWAFIAWSLGMLAHYDAIFIAPVVIFLLYKFVKDQEIPKKEKLLKLGFSALLSIILVGAFYIPFVTNLSDDTVSYWQGRITGDVSGKISSSVYLFTVYQPIYARHLYLALFIVGLILSLLSLPKLSTNIFLISNKYMMLAIYLWFLVGLFFMEFLVYIPGTHIYVYLLPLFIIMGFGVYFIQNVLYLLLGYRYSSVLFYLGVTAVFMFLFLQSYYIFVNHTKEYPWEEKDFFIWKFNVPNGSYHLSLFGFPYYRNWEGISDFLENYHDTEIKAFSSNERRSITRYYIDLEKSVDKAGAFIKIKNPQSFIQESSEEKAEYWASKHSPVYTLSKSGHEIVSIYIMPEGSYENIVAKDN